MLSSSRRFLATGSQKAAQEDVEDDSDELPLVDMAAGTHNASHSDMAYDQSTRQRNTSLRLGKPKKKRYIEPLDTVGLIISILSCALAILAVANNRIAWNLQRTNQLVVIGFLLSIMNLCLGRVLPYLFLLVEARFGRSTIQNYDGILRNQFLKPGLAFHWRLTIFAFLGLPLGLSVAYKKFDGGSSSLRVNATELTDMPALYGLFHVPDIPSVRDDNMALSLFFNASSPFKIATAFTSSSDEPPLPQKWPRPYGVNILVLDDMSTALLDMPWDKRLKALQASLALGDSLNITADVRGTVALYNTSVPVSRDPEFASRREMGSFFPYTLDLYNEYFLGLISARGYGFYSLIWMGFLHGVSDVDDEKWAQFRDQVRRYDISRRACWGTWTVTRGNVELKDGSCRLEPLPGLSQYILNQNSFVLGERYMSVLAGSIGVFAKSRSGSPWTDVSMTTAAASMLWSVMVGLNGEGKDEEDPHLDRVTFIRPGDDKPLTSADLGTLYSSEETIIFTRSSLWRSPWLYAILIIHPALMILALAASALFHSVPIDKGFGVVSILAGIERDSMDLLQGASLSGELERHEQGEETQESNVRVQIMPEHQGSTGTVVYRLVTSVTARPNGRLRKGYLYS